VEKFFQELKYNISS
jgi:hypothetical protein